MVIRRVVPNAEGEILPIAVRNVERAEQPVPKRQAAAEILVEVPWVVRVMNLMMRRTEDDATQPTGHWDPQMRMLEMSEDPHERDEDDAGTRTDAKRRPEPDVMQDTVGCADEQAQTVSEYDAVHRMNTKVRQGRKHLRRMVHLVELP